MRTATRITPPWTVNIARVREVALGLASDADVAGYTVAAIEMGAPVGEAKRIAELLTTRQQRTHGCL